MSPRVSIIIPMYNESAIIEKTLSSLVSYLDGRFAQEYELLFVDDGSQDGTASVAAALVAEMAKMKAASAAAEGRLLVIGYRDNRGKGAAVREGMLRARGDVRIFTDCDLAYGTDVLGSFYDALAASAEKAAATSSPRPTDADVKWEDGLYPSLQTEAASITVGADLPDGPQAVDEAFAVFPAIAIGSRDIHEDGYRGYTPFRRFVSRTYRAILRAFFALPVSDSQCGIKGFTAPAAERIFSVAETNRYAFDFEIITLATRARIPIRELPVCVVNNRKSRIRLVRDSARMLSDLVKTKRRLGRK